MNATKRNDEDAPGSVHDLRLVALVLDLVERHGKARAAEVLGVSYHTLASAADTGRLSGRMRDALGRHLLEGSGRDAPDMEKRVAVLERRTASLEEAAMQPSDSNVRVEDRDGTLGRLQEEMASLTRRVEGLETRQGSSQHGPATASVAPSTLDPLFERVVSDQPEPDEATRFGAAAPLVAEWRRLRDDFDAAPNELAKLLAEWDLLELEIVMIGVCGLTLPPHDFPWDRFELEDETRRRQHRMVEMRGEIRREKRRRRLRRICTLGLCKE